METPISPKLSPPLSSTEIEEQLDVYVDSILSSRRTAAAPSRKLAELSFAQQQLVLYWVEIAANTNAELAFQFASYANQAIDLLDNEGLEAWLVLAMDVFDKTGLYAAIDILKDVEKYSQERNDKVSGIVLDDVSSVLENFIHGLNGRPLKIQASESIYTDTEYLYLPAVVSLFPEKENNFKFYKVLCVSLWAQTWYGTWLHDPSERIVKYEQSKTALNIFHRLEIIRIQAKLEKELPGLHRDLSHLIGIMQQSIVPPQWHKQVDVLFKTDASVEDSWQVLSQLYHQGEIDDVCFQGKLFPDQVNAVIAERKQRDKDALRIALAKLAQQQTHDEDKTPFLLNEEQLNEQESDNSTKFNLNINRDEENPFEFRFELDLDGQPIIPPDDVKSTIASIIQDLSIVPEDYLVPAGDGVYSQQGTQSDKNPDDVWKGAYHEEGAFLYNEWDYQRDHYRKNWAVLRERDVHPQHDNYVNQVTQKYSGLITQLRRTFEALRGEEKQLKKQAHGENLDIDALVEGFADVQSGMELDERMYIKNQKIERNIAVMFMVDMSGSTKGWINNAERESLVLLAESLETLGDRYAIYGFSGFTRKKCEAFRVKRFDEPYNDDVRARISGIKPQDYTRMGVVIRHLSHLLNEVEARTKLLITLSDGKPDDLDGYRGKYGIEDTRQALIEAKRDGIHSFCITIDEEAGEYLPHMYGAVNYIVIDEVAKLPLKVSEIYRKITT